MSEWLNKQLRVGAPEGINAKDVSGECGIESKLNNKVSFFIIDVSAFHLRNGHGLCAGFESGKFL